MTSAVVCGFVCDVVGGGYWPREFYCLANVPSIPPCELLLASTADQLRELFVICRPEDGGSSRSPPPRIFLDVGRGCGIVGGNAGLGNILQLQQTWTVVLSYSSDPYDSSHLLHHIHI